MSDNIIYKSTFQKRSHSTTPLFTFILLAAITVYFYYSQNNMIDGIFILFAAIGVLIVTIIAISY